ncbi:MAG: CCA tRNA nucleotidyltransferase [Phycisphaerae bacterium]|nr:CCA tRNA nucleotidyltransferase [Phycisphaerae bacterium]
MTNKQAAVKIVKTLREEGFAALLAGGCVRDMLLGRPAKDYDVATNATPDKVMKLFKRTIAVGAKFGVVIVMQDKQQVEVATFRSESGYKDGRHPTKVDFVSTKEDASRRDFTINGMFYDPVDKKVIDYVGGQKDLEKKIIRTIGEPGERFGEDYLRMLRAVRFASALDFQIEKRTWEAIVTHCSKITCVSGERICVELEAGLAHPNRAKYAQLLVETGLAAAIFPGFAGESTQQSLAICANLPRISGFLLAVAGFFGGFETKFAVEAVKLLKLSRNQQKHFKFLLTNRGKLLNTEMSVAQLKMLAAEPYFDDLFELQKAICKASGGMDRLRKTKSRLEELVGTELRPKPLLDGYALMGLGAVAGPQVGTAAREMYIAQLEGQIKTIEQAEKWVKKWLFTQKTRD